MLEGLRSLFHQALRFDGNDATMLVSRWNEEIDYIQSVFDNMTSKKPTLPRTNADRIRSMTDEEMVEVIVEWCPDPEIGKCEYAPYKDLCKQCWLNWLKQEVTDERKI